MTLHRLIASQRADMAEMVVYVWLVEGCRLAGETKSTATKPIAPARAITCKVRFIGPKWVATARGSHAENSTGTAGNARLIMADDDESRPRLRLAVENDTREIERERAKRDIEWPLRELAANVIRVVRGAGKPHEIAKQCALVIEAFQRYREQAGCWPSSWEINEALSIGQKIENPTYDEAQEREYARDTILAGALQVAASRLVGQNTQEQRGRSEMMEGVRGLEYLREEARKRLAEAERARRQTLKPKKSAPKRAGKKKS